MVAKRRDNCQCCHLFLSGAIEYLNGVYLFFLWNSNGDLHRWYEDSTDGGTELWGFGKTYSENPTKTLFGLTFQIISSNRDILVKSINFNYKFLNFFITIWNLKFVKIQRIATSVIFKSKIVIFFFNQLSINTKDYKYISFKTNLINSLNITKLNDS